MISNFFIFFLSTRQIYYKFVLGKLLSRLPRYRRLFLSEIIVKCDNVDNIVQLERRSEKNLASNKGPVFHFPHQLGSDIFCFCFFQAVFSIFRQGETILRMERTAIVYCCTRFCAKICIIFLFKEVCA